MVFMLKISTKPDNTNSGSYKHVDTIKAYYIISRIHLFAYRSYLDNQFI